MITTKPWVLLLSWWMHVCAEPFANEVIGALFTVSYPGVVDLFVSDVFCFFFFFQINLVASGIRVITQEKRWKLLNKQSHFYTNIS